MGGKTLALLWTGLFKGLYKVCQVLFCFQPHLLKGHSLEGMGVKVGEMDILKLYRNISRLGASEAKIGTLFLSPQTEGGLRDRTACSHSLWRPQRVGSP